MGSSGRRVGDCGDGVCYAVVQCMVRIRKARLNFAKAASRTVNQD